MERDHANKLQSLYSSRVNFNTEKNMEKNLRLNITECDHSMTFMVICVRLLLSLSFEILTVKYLLKFDQLTDIYGFHCDFPHS